MKWITYETRFRQKAKRQQVKDIDIENYLAYAKKLFEKRVPVIFDLTHLSQLVGYNEEYLIRAENKTHNFYRYYNIPKRNGGIREIAEPLPSLKEIQKWILSNILNKCKCNAYIKSFLPKKSIKTNAKYHRNQKKVLTIDIQNYFPSISRDTIEIFFLDLGYNKDVSETMARLCCLDDFLPQGAPTSPMLSNLVTSNIDYRVSDFTNSKGLYYSRYADDLTISGDFNSGRVINNIRKILAEEGFEVNEDKVRVQGRHERQIVTGIVVNLNLSIGRKRLRSIRQAMFYIQKFGIQNHLIRTQVTKRNYLGHLMGVITYALFIDPKNLEMQSYLEVLREIKRKESEGE